MKENEEDATISSEKEKCSDSDSDGDESEEERSRMFEALADARGLSPEVRVLLLEEVGGVAEKAVEACFKFLDHSKVESVVAVSGITEERAMRILIKAGGNVGVALERFFSKTEETNGRELKKKKENEKGKRKKQVTEVGGEAETSQQKQASRAAAAARRDEADLALGTMLDAVVESVREVERRGEEVLIGMRLPEQVPPPDSLTDPHEDVRNGDCLYYGFYRLLELLHRRLLCRYPESVPGVGRAGKAAAMRRLLAAFLEENWDLPAPGGVRWWESVGMTHYVDEGDEISELWAAASAEGKREIWRADFADGQFGGESEISAFATLANGRGIPLVLRLWRYSGQNRRTMAAGEMTLVMRAPEPPAGLWIAQRRGFVADLRHSGRRDGRSAHWELLDHGDFAGDPERGSGASNSRKRKRAVRPRKGAGGAAGKYKEASESESESELEEP